MQNYSADLRMIEAYSQERQRGLDHRNLADSSAEPEAALNVYAVSELIEAVRALSSKLQYSGSA